ncbi:MAG: hypothetical protein IKX55_08740 [Bacteroidaceae bacterium]|nr:hypothetical protein [Bacteroidaceae bacterium]
MEYNKNENQRELQSWELDEQDIKQRRDRDRRIGSLGAIVAAIFFLVVLGFMIFIIVNMVRIERSF